MDKQEKKIITTYIFQRICDEKDPDILKAYGITYYNQKKLIFNKIEFEENFYINNEEFKDEIEIGEDCKITNLIIQSNLQSLKILCDAETIKVYSKIQKAYIKGNINEVYFLENSYCGFFKFHGSIKELDINCSGSTFELSGNFKSCFIYGAISTINTSGIIKNLELNSLTRYFRNFSCIENLNTDGDIQFFETEGKIQSFFNRGLIYHFIAKGAINKFDNFGTIQDTTINGKISSYYTQGESSSVIVNKSASVSEFFTYGGMIKKVSLYGSFKKVQIKGKSEFISFSGKADSIFFGGQTFEFELNGECKKIELKEGEIKDLVIRDHISENKIELFNCKIEDSVKIEKSSFDSLTIKRDHSSEFKIELYAVKLNLFSIKDSFFRENDLIKINFCNIDNFGFMNSNNLGSIFISGLETKKENYGGQVFSIINSNLGNTQFINCDLRNYQCFTFQNSKILDCFFADTTFPLEKDLILAEGNDLEKYEQKRLFFSQIKQIFENQGDSSRAGEARAQELESFRKLLKHQIKTSSNYISGFFLKEVWECRKTLFILWVNKTSNYYGNNWLRATLITLLVTCICYSYYLYLVGYCPGNDSNKFWELSSYTLSYLNPFRDEDTSKLLEVFARDAKVGYIKWSNSNESNVYSVPPMARIWDHVSRILVIFMVYQTVAAFRRLGKFGS